MRSSPNSWSGDAAESAALIGCSSRLDSGSGIFVLPDRTPAGAAPRSHQRVDEEAAVMADRLLGAWLNQL